MTVLKGHPYNGSGFGAVVAGVKMLPLDIICYSIIPLRFRVTTEDPSWGYPSVVLGAIVSFLEPFRGHLSAKVDEIFQQ